MSDQMILPSWRTGGVKEIILAYVQGAIDPNSPSYIPRKNRIVTMDIDGTIIPEMGPKVDNDLMTVHSVPWVVQYLKDIENHFFDESKNFRYGSMLYQPMKELYEYLVANDFSIFFVSGNCNALTYAWANHFFGAEYAHCVGSNVDYRIDDSQGYSLIPIAMTEGSWCEVKCYRIMNQLGQCPVIAIGNSDGDVPMLRMVRNNPDYKSLALMINHDDPREYVYNTEEITSYCSNYDLTRVDMSSDFLTL